MAFTNLIRTGRLYRYNVKIDNNDEELYLKQEAAADSWWYKTPMEKRRQKVLQRLEEAQAEAENGG